MASHHPHPNIIAHLGLELTFPPSTPHIAFLPHNPPFLVCPLYPFAPHTLHPDRDRFPSVPLPSPSPPQTSPPPHPFTWPMPPCPCLPCHTPLPYTFPSLLLYHFICITDLFTLPPSLPLIWFQQLQTWFVTTLPIPLTPSPTPRSHSIYLGV